MVSNVPDSQDEILTQILGSDARTSSFTKADTTNMDSTASTASGSSNLEDACMEGGVSMITLCHQGKYLLSLARYSFQFIRYCDLLMVI